MWRVTPHKTLHQPFLAGRPGLLPNDFSQRLIDLCNLMQQVTHAWLLLFYYVVGP
jgi:hypothetical protein